MSVTIRAPPAQEGFSIKHESSIRLSLARDKATIPPDSVRCIVSILQQKLYRNVQSGNDVGVSIEENIQTKRVVAQLERSTANGARCN